MVSPIFFGLAFGAVALVIYAAGVPAPVSAAIAIGGALTGFLRAMRLALVDQGASVLVRNPFLSYRLLWKDVDAIGLATPALLKGIGCPSLERREGKPIAVCGLLVFGGIFGGTTNRDEAVIERVHHLAGAHGLRWTAFRAYCDNALGRRAR